MTLHRSSGRRKMGAAVPPEPAMPPPDAYERKLAGAARRRLAGTGDGELMALLDHVANRRSGRLGIAPRGPTAAPEVGPAHDRPTPTPTPASRATPTPGTGPAGEILAIDRVGADVACFVLRRPPGFGFRAGQNVKAGLPGRGRHRYSIASSPDEPTLELCIERVPGGRLTPSLFDLRVGDRIELAERAGGSFTLDERAPRHLMVATVTGIAPFRSMVRDARHRGLAVDLTVLHGASHVDELPYRQELEALAAVAGAGVRYVPTVSRPTSPRNSGWGGRTGRVDELALELAGGFDPAATRVYACGNGGMVARVAAELGARGFRVSTESYD